MAKNQIYRTWRQDDPRYNVREAWPEASFPEAAYHYFREAGCLVCSLAILLRHHDIEKEADEESFNPWILNEKLIACGAFDAAADLVLNRVSRLYPLDYCGAVPYTGKALEEIVQTEALCLITVPGVLGVSHFIMLDHLLDNDAAVIDPAKGNRYLSDYETVKDIRVFRSSGSR